MKVVRFRCPQLLQRRTGQHALQKQRTHGVVSSKQPANAVSAVTDERLTFEDKRIGWWKHFKDTGRTDPIFVYLFGVGDEVV